MHTRCGCFALIVSSLALAPAATPPAAGQTACQPPTSLDVVVTPNPPTDECDPGGFPIDFFDAHSWQMFIALNWPAASGQRGVPDTAKTIADRTSPRVWETWKSVEEVFMADGKADGTPPKDWSQPETTTLCANAAELGSAPTKLLADLNQGDDNGGVVGPLVAQNRTYVRYEIRMNKVEFDQIVGKKFYLRDNLPVKDETGAAAELPLFPDGTTNIKAAWREARPGESTDRYYRTDALAVDPITGRCDQRSFVLIGFHIGQRTPQRKQWIWSTFEHVDNVTVGADAPAGTKPSLNDPSKPQSLGANPGQIDASHPPKPDPDPVQVVFQAADNMIPSQTAATNTKWQSSSEIRNSVWRFYQLIKTQWPINPNAGELGDPFPRRRVANLTMETYLQASSCIACHAKTSHRTDFIWFLSNRAFPIKDNLSSNAKVAKDRATPPQ
jgi:hypothetical protein